MEALGTLGRRLIAWLILVVAVLVVLKLVAGVVLGFVHFVLWVAILGVVGFGVLWALRHL
jgi:hypothetical protein